MNSLRRVQWNALRSATKLIGAIVAAFALVSSFDVPVVAQAPREGRSYPATPNLVPINHPATPTGELASFARLAKRSSNAAQPVQWKLPEGTKASVAQSGLFAPSSSDDNEFGLFVGSVYRFRLDSIPFHQDRALYPSVELIGRINPPAGKEWDFPLVIEVPQEDLDLAFEGCFVTRVIFLENSENAANVDASESNAGLTLEVPAGVDPVVAANTQGRAVAILRLGSKAPSSEPNAEDPFFFGLPNAQFRPVQVDALEDFVPEVAEETAEKAIEEATETTANADGE